jgi:hypothetical protein
MQRLGCNSYKIPIIAIILILLPVISASTGTGFGVFKASTQEIIINNYYPNPVQYSSCIRTNPTSFLAGIRNKSSSSFVLYLLYFSKYINVLKPNGNIGERYAQHNLFAYNLEFTYLLSDLPPPFSQA